jgi:hypothetical protein
LIREKDEGEFYKPAEQSEPLSGSGFIDGISFASKNKAQPVNDAANGQQKRADQIKVEKTFFKTHCFF